MGDELAELMGTMALHIAHERGWALEDAIAWIEERMDEAQTEYREAGAPLGDTDEGFVAWLQPRHQPPTA